MVITFLKRFLGMKQVPCVLKTQGWSCGHIECEEYEDTLYWEELKASLDGGKDE